MKLSLWSCELILLAALSFAQQPEFDHVKLEEMALQQEKLYRNITLNEQQITANQEEYDVRYYALDLTPDPAARILHGVVRVEGKVVAQTLDHIELNFWTGMTVTDVHATSHPDLQLTRQHVNDLLSINLDKIYLHGETFSLIVAYKGCPQNSSYGSFHFDTRDEKPMIWTLSQPSGARAWWPCKDIPSDKADSVDIHVTVPSNLIVASNGTLKGKILADGKTTYWWHEEYPIVTYLVSLVIHPYEVHYDDYIYNDGSDTMQIHFYTFAGNYNRYSTINAKVKNMIACFSKLFGQYPFIEEKYGHADFLANGAMEHQTCTSFGPNFWNEPTYAHELAHQWWGDMITCDSFHHIWLNEGFATYSQALWDESAYPSHSASAYQMANHLYMGPGTVYVEHLESETIFDINLSYQKASWVLHMLRHVVGDSTFFKILKTYGASPTHQHGTATTEEFQAICEEASGMNLDKFFHQWIYEEYFPQYSFTRNRVWMTDGFNYNIHLEIQQTQTNYIFWMPIDVTVSTVEGDTTFVVWDSLQTQYFDLVLTSEPTGIQLDKDNWILKQFKQEIVTPSFDKGILLVNGVSFSDYGSAIRDAYTSRAFWGDFKISFWDCFEAPQGGYPASLPQPLGHGKIPTDILAQFSTVIWIGNHYGGDLGTWHQTAILPYLKAGGNLILIARSGKYFINDEMADYLGITWVEDPEVTIRNCVSAYPGLQTMTFAGEQSMNAVFDTNLSTAESKLLFKETLSFSVPRGLGVWRKPEAGGQYRNGGSQFVFLSGRPYRFSAPGLRTNIEYILANFFNEAKTGVNVAACTPNIHTYRLEQNHPNPFNACTTIEFALPKSSFVTLKVHNLLGEVVATLVSEQRLAGIHTLNWDASGLASGVYLYQLQTDGFVQSKKLIVMR